jgi:hypothetical protein
MCPEARHQNEQYRQSVSSLVPIPIQDPLRFCTAFFSNRAPLLLSSVTQPVVYVNHYVRLPAPSAFSRRNGVPEAMNGNHRARLPTGLPACVRHREPVQAIMPNLPAHLSGKTGILIDLRSTRIAMTVLLLSRRRRSCPSLVFRTATMRSAARG